MNLQGDGDGGLDVEVARFDGGGGGGGDGHGFKRAVDGAESGGLGGLCGEDRHDVDVEGFGDGFGAGAGLGGGFAKSLVANCRIVFEAKSHTADIVGARFASGIDDFAEEGEVIHDDLDRIAGLIAGNFGGRGRQCIGTGEKSNNRRS